MTCISGKTGYETAADAKASLGRLISANKRDHHERRHYRCPICFKYHLTSQRPGRRRKKRRGEV